MFFLSFLSSGSALSQAVTSGRNAFFSGILPTASSQRVCKNSRVWIFHGE